MANAADIMGMTKKKLVTLFSSKSTITKDSFPFTYKGSNKLEKTDVKITFPAYPGNVAYYEHFDNVKSPHCNRLSFIFLGGNEEGGLEHHFGEYEQVTAVDFGSAFASVGSLFTLVNQLPKCREVNFFLNQDNLRLSKFDHDQQALPLNNPAISNKVSELRIQQVGNINPYIWNQETTRLTTILRYAYKCFPNLKSVRIVMNGDGRNYDLVQSFVQGKANLLKHDVTLKDDVVTCTPSVSNAAVVNQRKRSFDKVQVFSPSPVPAKQLTPAPVSTVMKNTEVNTSEDKDKVDAHQQINIKQEIKEVPDVEVIDIKQEVVSSPEVNTGAITPVMSPAPVAPPISYQQQYGRVPLVLHRPSVPRSDRAATPTAPCLPNSSQRPQSPVTTERAPSSDIGSSFTDWEISSESDEDDIFLNGRNDRKMTCSSSSASHCKKRTPATVLILLTDRGPPAAPLTNSKP